MQIFQKIQLSKIDSKKPCFEVIEINLKRNKYQFSQNKMAYKYYGAPK